MRARSASLTHNLADTLGDGTAETAAFRTAGDVLRCGPQTSKPRSQDGVVFVDDFRAGQSEQVHHGRSDLFVDAFVREIDRHWQGGDRGGVVRSTLPGHSDPAWQRVLFPPDGTGRRQRPYPEAWDAYNAALWNLVGRLLSVTDLEYAIRRFTDAYNDRAKAFAWTTTVGELIAKITHK